MSSVVLPGANNFGALEFPTFRKWVIDAHDHFIPHERNNYHPHILSHRLVALVSILAVTIKIVGVSLVAFSPAAPIEAAAISTETIVSLTNEARVQNSLGELTVSGLLSKAAQSKANDMLARQYFSHNTPDGATPWSFIKAVGYSYTTAGENLAIDFTEAESVQAAWMNSPGHRANILNNKFKEIGIGIAKGMYDNHQTTIVVQMFGAPIAQQVELQQSPTPVQAASPARVAPEAQPTVSQQPAQVATGQPVAQPVAQAAPTTEPVAATVPPPIYITDTKTALQGSELYLEVTASSNVVTLLAFYGNRSIMLNPIGENVWQGKIPLAHIGANDNLVVQAEDVHGKLHQQPVAQFSQGLGLELKQGTVGGEEVTIFGAKINPKIWEEKIFLVILAGLVASLLLAIAIKRHIQHVSLVANTSFAAILIAMLMLV